MSDQKMNMITEARRLLHKGIDEHPYLPYYVKDLAKEQVTRAMAALSNAIAGLELSCYRTEHKLNDEKGDRTCPEK